MYPYYLYDGVPRLYAHKIISEINTCALEHNFNLLKALADGRTAICVVKADAYGHTSEICVPVLLRSGCSFFAVSCIEEAMAVRNICNREGSHADILILGYTDPSQVKLLADNNIIQTAISLKHAESLSGSAASCGCTVRIHVAVDTGMNRIGICANSEESCTSAALQIERITKLPNLLVEGMFTHFARSDEELFSTIADNSHTRMQAYRFAIVRDSLLKMGIGLFCHTCNSAATIRFPEYMFDGVRIGIMLYGVYPSKHFDDIGLLPVMSLSTVISHMHDVPCGESVSYGGIFIAEKETKIATLPIGYADGLLRKYTGANVTVCTSKGNFKAKIIGRICMDQCMIDVTGIPADVGDRIIIFGNDPCELSRLAQLADTIEYECLCLISARVPRVLK